MTRPLLVTAFSGMAHLNDAIRAIAVAHLARNWRSMTILHRHPAGLHGVPERLGGWLVTQQVHRRPIPVREGAISPCQCAFIVPRRWLLQRHQRRIWGMLFGMYAATSDVAWWHTSDLVLWATMRTMRSITGRILDVAVSVFRACSEGCARVMGH